MAVYSKFLELISAVPKTVDLSTNTLAVQGLQINAATGGGALTQAAHSATTSYSIIWPAAQAGGSGLVLSNDGAGNLSWASGSSGANTSLSNLSAVAINTSLLPASSNTINLGSLSDFWAEVYAAVFDATDPSGNQATYNAAGITQTSTTDSSFTISSSAGKPLSLVTLSTGTASGNLLLRTANSGTSGDIDLTTGTGSTLRGSINLNGLAVNVGISGSGSPLILNADSGALTMSAANPTTSYGIIWPSTQGGASTVLQNDGTGILSWASASSGTVTSVAFADDSTAPIYSVSGSPITSAGTLGITLVNQAANTVFSGPASGSAAQPSFRSLVAADIPSLSALYANVNLSNLGTTSISQDLLPASAGSNNIGSATLPWNVGYFFETSYSELGVQWGTINVGGVGRPFVISAIGGGAATGNNLNLTTAAVSGAGHSSGLIQLTTGAATGGATQGKILLAGAFVDANSTNVSNVANPVNPQDAVTLSYANANYAPISGGGTVTSVAFADDSTTPIYAVSGSPVTSAGTLAITLNTQNANLVFAGPATGSAAQPSFRSLVSADIPSLSAIYLPLAGGTMSGSIDMGSNSITSLASPVNPNDAVNKAYVDNFINATSWKTAVLVATTANITLSGEQTIDGVTTSASRVLVKNQSSPSDNGIYVSAAGAWARSSDMNVWADVPAAAVFVESGTVNADLGWVCTSQPGGTLGTTAITFVQFSSAGAYSADNVTLQLISGVFSIKNAGVGPTQLGVVTDGVTLDQSGAGSTIEIKAAGVGTTQLAAASVTAAKLGAVTDGITLDQSGAGSTLEIKAAGVSATQLATGAFDQTTITGGAGTPASVVSSPTVQRVMVAGQSFSANTTYAVRWGIPDNSETAGRVYAADWGANTFDEFWVIGLFNSATAISAGNNITMVVEGPLTLGSSDTNFGSSDQGKPAWLGAAGAYQANSAFAPTSGNANAKLGIVENATVIWVDAQMMGVS